MMIVVCRSFLIKTNNKIFLPLYLLLSFIYGGGGGGGELGENPKIKNVVILKFFVKNSF
jgi:hypothetical protein